VLTVAKGWEAKKTSAAVREQSSPGYTWKMPWKDYRESKGGAHDNCLFVFLSLATG